MDALHKPARKLLIRPAQWPPWLRDAWAAARSPSPSLFHPELTRDWSADTWRIAEEGLSKLVTVLREEPVVTEGDLVALVTEAHLVHLVQTMQAVGLTLRTQQTYLTGISLASRALAPAQDWQWIRSGIDQLRAMTPSPGLISAASVGTDTLVDLGKRRFWAAWENGAASVPALAVEARDGLIVAFLALRPLRRRNLAALRLGEHVRIEQDRVRITIDSSEMKGRFRGYKSDWPNALRDEFRCYIDHIRPLLISCRPRNPNAPPAGDALWVSEDGTALSADAIYRQVRTLTSEAFGEPINLHRFRHLAASTLAIHRPDQIHLAQDVLGHHDPRSKEFYIQADQLSAIRRSHRTEDHLLADDLAKDDHRARA